MEETQAGWKRNLVEMQKKTLVGQCRKNITQVQEIGEPVLKSRVLAKNKALSMQRKPIRQLCDARGLWVELHAKFDKTDPQAVASLMRTLWRTDFPANGASSSI